MVFSSDDRRPATADGVARIDPVEGVRLSLLNGNRQLFRAGYIAGDDGGAGFTWVIPFPQFRNHGVGDVPGRKGHVKPTTGDEHMLPADSQHMDCHLLTGFRVCAQESTAADCQRHAPGRDAAPRFPVNAGNHIVNGGASHGAQDVGRPPGGFVEPYLILRDQHLDPVVDYHQTGDAPLLPSAGFFVPNRDNRLIHTGHAGS